MELFLKALAGAAVVIVIQILSRTKNFYIAGLVPLFPTFTLISNYIVGSERTASEFKRTIAFGMLSIIPYFAYLLSLYFLVGRFPLSHSLLGATLCWIVCAALLIAVWGRL